MELYRPEAGNFPVNFAKFLKTFFIGTPPVAASDLILKIIKHYPADRSFLAL